MKFSVIIPTRSMNDYIKEAMPYFQKQTFKDFEIIIVSEEKIKVDGAKNILVGKIPPSGKRNRGVKEAKGEIIAFIDDDAYHDERWLEIANKIFEDEKIVAVGGPSLVPKNAIFFQRVSNKVYELSSGKTGIRYCQSKAREIDDWPTCNFFVRKNAFLETKGFDEKYWGGEDTQLCYSLTGKKIYSPHIIIYHHPRKDIGKHLKQTFFWGMLRGFFMRIHKQSRHLSFFIPALFVLWIALGGLMTIIAKPVGYLYAVSLVAYLGYLIFLGIKAGKLFFPVIVTTFLTHIAYGLGFLRGISSKNAPTKKTLNPAEAINIKAKSG